MPETWVPTCTDFTGFKVPLALMVTVSGPSSILTVRNSGSFKPKRSLAIREMTTNRIKATLANTLRLNHRRCQYVARVATIALFFMRLKPVSKLLHGIGVFFAFKDASYCVGSKKCPKSLVDYTSHLKYADSGDDLKIGFI